MLLCPNDQETLPTASFVSIPIPISTHAAVHAPPSSRKSCSIPIAVSRWPAVCLRGHWQPAAWHGHSDVVVCLPWLPFSSSPWRCLDPPCPPTSVTYRVFALHCRENTPTKPTPTSASYQLKSSKSGSFLIHDQKSMIHDQFIHERKKNWVHFF